MNENTMNENTTGITPPVFPTYGKYVRKDTEGRIIKGFSDYFEAPQEGDVLLYRDPGIQFRLLPDGAPNPRMTEGIVKGAGDESGEYTVAKYKYDEGILSRTATEMTADAEAQHLAALPGILRAKRKRLLEVVDYTQWTHVPMADEKREEYRVYMQALRDITEQPGFPTDVVWPVKPA
jgi:hypothetical protein